MALLFPKLPYVVQTEVLKQLELQEAFLLSLSSEKTKKVVQSLNRKPASVMYSFVENGIQVLVEYNANDQWLYPVGNLKFVPTISRSEMTPMKLGGNKISCRCIKEEAPESSFTHTFLCLALEEVSVLESLQRHMKDFFRFDARIQLGVTSLRDMNISHIFENVTDTCFQLEELDTEQLENYLTAHPNQDSLQLITKLAGPPLRDDSRLWEIKGLSIHGAGDRIANFFMLVVLRNPRMRFSEILNNFRGHYLYLTDVVYEIGDWVSLIRRWKRKEAYHELKYVSTTAHRETAIMFEAVTREFNFVEWDGQRRPRTAEFDAKIINILPKEGGIDCSDWRDIQQDGGGKWASIKLTQTCVKFVVWE